MTDNELLLAMSTMMDRKLIPFGEKLDRLDERLDHVENRLDRVENRLDSVENRLSNVENRLDNVENRLGNVENQLHQVQEEQSKMNLVIELELRPNIRLLAENYLPAAKRYENSIEELEAVKMDVAVLKKTVAEHSEKLRKIA